MGPYEGMMPASLLLVSPYDHTHHILQLMITPTCTKPPVLLTLLSSLSLSSRTPIIDSVITTGGFMDMVDYGRFKYFRIFCSLRFCRPC